jgi:hypothetical protein
MVGGGQRQCAWSVCWERWAQRITAARHTRMASTAAGRWIWEKKETVTDRWAQAVQAWVELSGSHWVGGSGLLRKRRFKFSETNFYST